MRVRRETLRDLGITTDHWLVALALSALPALFYLPPLLALADRYQPAQIVPHPFFLFGWLQLRFELVLDVLQAILLTGLSFARTALGLAYA